MKLVEIKDVRVGQIWKDKDGDFFVGVTNFQVITAHDVALQVLKFFNDNGAKE